MPKEILTLYTKLLVNRGSADEELIDLLSTPDLGIGDPEKVEVTNLQDGTRRYVNGLKDVGDSLEFEFNYITDNYQVLKEIEESKQIYTYKVVLPDKLCFTFDAALSVKITGAAVGEQVKMTINLTPYSTIEVGPYEDNAGQQGRYSTFTIGQSRARSAGTLNLCGNRNQPIEELYINDVAQELPTGVTNETDDIPVITNYEVNPGDVVKIKGGFSLWETELPINNVVIQSDLTSCEKMFYGCTGLTEAPIIPTLVTNCKYMFAGCTNLAVIPQENINMMNNPPEGLICEDCYYSCPLVADSIPASWGGTKVEEPEEVPEEPTGEYTIFTIKSDCSMTISNGAAEPAMTELYIDDVQQTLPESETVYSVREGQKVKIKGHFKLKNANITGVTLQNNLTSCSSMFEGCANLTEAPIIPQSVVDCSMMFSGTAITKAPIIPNSVTNCSYMFNGCTNLTEAPVIPNGVKNCNSMFRDCVNLTEAPIIPSSVTLCAYMFSGCENMTTLPTENVYLMNFAGYIRAHGYCYSGCTNIVTPIKYNEIPAGWK